MVSPSLIPMTLAWYGSAAHDAKASSTMARIIANWIGWCLLILRILPQEDRCSQKKGGQDLEQEVLPQ